MEFSGLSEEKKDLIANCDTAEEVFDLLKQEGVELTDEQLESVAGGHETSWTGSAICPRCGSTHTYRFRVNGGDKLYSKCYNCYYNEYLGRVE